MHAGMRWGGLLGRDDADGDEITRDSVLRPHERMVTIPCPGGHTTGEAVPLTVRGLRNCVPNAVEISCGCYSHGDSAPTVLRVCPQPRPPGVPEVLEILNGVDSVRCHSSGWRLQWSCAPGCRGWHKASCAPRACACA